MNPPFTTVQRLLVVDGSPLRRRIALSAPRIPLIPPTICLNAVTYTLHGSKYRGWTKDNFPALSLAVCKEYANIDFVKVDNWILSRDEAQLYALISLLHATPKEGSRKSLDQRSISPLNRGAKAKTR